MKALRESFVKVLKDPELLAEAKKARMEVEHTPGEELDTLIKDVLDQPPEVVDRAKAFRELSLLGERLHEPAAQRHSDCRSLKYSSECSDVGRQCFHSDFEP